MFFDAARGAVVVAVALFVGVLPIAIMSEVVPEECRVESVTRTAMFILALLALKRTTGRSAATMALLLLVGVALRSGFMILQWDLSLFFLNIYCRTKGRPTGTMALLLLVGLCS